VLAGQDPGQQADRKCQKGSFFWDKDPEFDSMGRLGQTCLALLILETYYRHLPLPLGQK
jgi:hypothetical protein